MSATTATRCRSCGEGCREGRSFCGRCQRSERAPQHMQALQRANEVRFAHAALREELAALPRLEGKARLADLIETTTEDAYLRAKVEYLLTCPDRQGPRWAETLMRRLTIPLGKRLGSLTRRERDLLAAALREDSIKTRSYHGWKVAA